jgi:hypothetical protein
LPAIMQVEQNAKNYGRIKSSTQCIYCARKGLREKGCMKMAAGNGLVSLMVAGQRGPHWARQCACSSFKPITFSSVQRRV